MANPNTIIADAAGLQSQPNELTLPAGSLAVAENVEITRDGIIEVSRGFEDFSDNLPDFTPEQILVIGGQAYCHLDNGLWYHDGTRWLRKRGETGKAYLNPNYAEVVDGILYFSGINTHVIFALNLATGARSVFAGRVGVSGSTNGTGGAARFNIPSGIATDGTNLYVGDQANSTIRKIVIATGEVTTFAGTAGASSTTDGTGSAARFSTPRAVCRVGDHLYVCDGHNHTIRKINISSAVVTTFAGTAGASGSADGTGTGATFNLPQGICSDGTHLYVADTANYIIRKIDLSTAVVTTIAGSAGLNNTNDGTGTAARFDNVVALATDNTNLYISDGGNGSIRRLVISSAVVTTPFGVSLSTGSSDGIGTSARFSGPRGVAISGSTLYVCDGTNNLIRKVYLDTEYVTTIDGDVTSYSYYTAGLPLANGIFAGPD